MTAIRRRKYNSTETEPKVLRVIEADDRAAPIAEWTECPREGDRWRITKRFFRTEYDFGSSNKPYIQIYNP